MMAPPPVTRQPQLSPAQVKKLKEMREKKENWVFANPEEAGKDSTLEEVFPMSEYDPDALEKKSLTPMERFYQRLQREHGSATNQVRERVEIHGKDDSLSLGTGNPFS